jgi:ATP-dependent Clp protease ATP-binding subunit ClpC
VAELGYQLSYQTKLKLVADKGFDKQFGARPLKRAIQNMLKMHLEEIITSKISIGQIFMDIEMGHKNLR